MQRQQQQKPNDISWGRKALSYPGREPVAKWSGEAQERFRFAPFPRASRRHTGEVSCPRDFGVRWNSQQTGSCSFQEVNQPAAEPSKKVHAHNTHTRPLLIIPFCVSLTPVSFLVLDNDRQDWDKKNYHGDQLVTVF